MVTNCTSIETIVGDFYLGVPRRLDYTILSSDGTQVLFHNGDESYRVFFELDSKSLSLFLQYHNEKNLEIERFTEDAVYFKKDSYRYAAKTAKPIEVIHKMDCTVTYVTSEPEPEPAPNREDYLGRWFKRDNVVLYIDSFDPYDQDAVYCKYFDFSSSDDEDYTCGTMSFSLFKEISTPIKQLFYRKENDKKANYIIDTYTELDESEAKCHFEAWIDGIADYLFGIE